MGEEKQPRDTQKTIHHLALLLGEQTHNNPLTGKNAKIGSGGKATGWHQSNHTWWLKFTEFSIQKIPSVA